MFLNTLFKKKICEFFSTGVFSLGVLFLIKSVFLNVSFLRIFNLFDLYQAQF